MSEEEFKQALNEFGIIINDTQLEQFRAYSKFLLEYNSHTNLTAIDNTSEVYLKHFFDSLMILKYEKITGKVLDIGSGAGFPGIPIKIMCPDVDLHLLDSNGKKTTFLEKLKPVLGIEYTVINDRAEKYVINKRESFDFVLSRAVAYFPVLLELAMPFVKFGGRFISYKGSNEEEVKAGIYAVETLGGAISKIEKTTLYGRSDPRMFIIVEKKSKTDIKYPRSFEKISKRPLQK